MPILLTHLAGFAIPGIMAAIHSTAIRLFIAELIGKVFAFMAFAGIIILIIGLIFYRFMFFCLDAGQLTPPFWNSLGAVAISTLAGDTLMLNADQWAFLAS